LIRSPFSECAVLSTAAVRLLYDMERYTTAVTALSSYLAAGCDNANSENHCLHMYNIFTLSLGTTTEQGQPLLLCNRVPLHTYSHEGGWRLC
jgi:hypothetical protein